ncbi:uncharacterized protein LOC136090508 isoform X1 [Hydra vulgaris]|uniref:Uncharacterized protein LOC136090508 isoform X1 n=1 Tax=Hydra vulgaris TaxID=6087 RepID=A0ABM4DFU3_HYDVU
MFYIVHFLNDNTVEYVPKEWLNGNSECMWPKCSMTSLKGMRRKRQIPNKDWERYKIRILSTADCEERALKKLKISEETSDLASEYEGNSCRRKTTSKRLSPSLFASQIHGNMSSEDDSDFNMPTSLQQAVISTSTPGSQPLLPIPHHANVFREMQHQGKSSQSFVSLLNDPDEINLPSLYQEFLPIPYTKNSTNTFTPITQSIEYRLSSIENLLKDLVKSVTSATKEIKHLIERMPIGHTEESLFTKSSSIEELDAVLLQCQDEEMASLFASFT